MSRRSVMVVAAAVVLLVGVFAGVVGYDRNGAHSAQPTPSPTPRGTPSPSPEPDPVVLAAATPIPAPGAPSLPDVLEPVLATGALGDRVAASVVDLTTGTPLFEVQAHTALVPASTLKILTAAAALDVLGEDRTFATRAVAGPEPGDVVLVGGGDPTLTVSDEPAMPRATRLAGLADATAAALTAAGTTTVQLLVDDGLFTGPAVDADWPSSYVSEGHVGPVSALAVDGGRARPDRRARSGDPALAAAASFAAMLTDRGVTVAEPVRGQAAPGATELAAVDSPPVAAIVEHMQATSDNDVAEVLGRHIARFTGRPATSEAASTAIVEAVSDLGVDLSGAAVLDASGLARGNGIPTAALTATLAAAADPQRPDLRAVLTGLPVAGFTGTLGDRFADPAAAPGAGVVRAKTGTLTGVSSLAGIVLARDGTAFGFAVLADGIANPLAARAALDDVAAALAGCGCGGTATVS